VRVLGLDVGSSSVKGAVLDLETGTVSDVTRASFPDPLAGQPPNHFEVSVDALQNCVTSVVADLHHQAPDADQLYCSSQMGGLILVDDRGKAHTNYISWRDQRTNGNGKSGTSYLDEIRGSWTPDQYIELGRELNPGSTLSLLYWLKENGQLQDNVYPVPLAEGIFSAAVNARPTMDVTHALGMLDLRNSSWHQPAFDALGLNSIPRPELVQTQPIGELTTPSGKLTYFASLGDQICALYGVQLQQDELSINVSTGCQVSQRTRQFQPGDYQSRRYMEGDYLNTITHLPAGRSLNALVDLLTEISGEEKLSSQAIWNSILKKVEQVPDTDLKVNLGFFSGPMGDSGTIDNIRTDNLTVGHLFRAAFESMAENFFTCAQKLSPDSNWNRLVLSGGLTQQVSPVRQAIERCFQVEIRNVHANEESLLGLLQMAKSQRVSSQ
jgi:sugar (pentulose or hexulose) kinase